MCPVDSAIALYQVNVVKIMVRSEMSWEIRATESTVVAPCPAALAAGMRLSIAQQGDAPVVALTGDAAGVDPDTAAATGSSIAAVDGVLVPAERRDLDGVFEVHSVQVMGVNSVLRNDAYCMRCCEKCKRHLEEGLQACAEHPSAGTEYRWLFQLELADGAGHCTAVLYHDAAVQIPGFPAAEEDPVPPKVMQKIVKLLREQPWSVRFAYQSSAARETNDLEIKLLLPTLTPDGIVGSWCVGADATASHRYEQYHGVSLREVCVGTL